MGEKYKQEKTIEIQQLKNELSTGKKDANAKKSALLDLTNDLAQQQKEQEQSESVLKTRVSSLEENVRVLQTNFDSCKKRLAELQTEVDLHQDSALTAMKNYERELDLHSAARSELRTARSNLDIETHRREAADNQIKTLTLEQE